VLSLSGVSAVIWLEGTNDFSRNGNASAAEVIGGMKEGIARIRAKIPGARVIGATVATALGSTSAAHGFCGISKEAHRYPGKGNDAIHS